MAEVFHLQLSDGQKYPYKIVLSKRAKYIRIKLTQQGDLSVTIPVLTKIKLGHEFVEQINDQRIINRTLNHWCKQKAKSIFNNKLQQLAELHGFHYQRLSIRAQKTRWGSCSHKKNINLNCKLLFMPEEVVRYVMIHELCHTIEMNHSNRFWALVEECDPMYKTHKKTLKTIGKSIVI